jgi:hypothetical protein
LDTIANNSAAWDLDKGNEPRFDFEYACVENFSTTILFEELRNKFGLVGVMGPNVHTITPRHAWAPAHDLSEASMASRLGMTCGKSCLTMLRFTL